MTLLSLKGMLGLCTYMSDIKTFFLSRKIFQNFNFPGKISGDSDFRFFLLRCWVCSCELGAGFDGGYNSEVETAGVNITIPSTNHQQLLHSQSYYETFLCYLIN